MSHISLLSLSKEAAGLSVAGHFQIHDSLILCGKAVCVYYAGILSVSIEIGDEYVETQSVLLFGCTVPMLDFSFLQSH